jgi:signal transduction histidine kinase
VHGVPERRRIVALAVAAGRDIERILKDPELLSLRVERLDLGALAAGLSAERVGVSVAGGSPVDGDPTRLRQALANLVENGLRHGSRVAIDVRELDDWVVVDVADDGPGVDSAVDVFARGASGAGSSGLGLWVARMIAERHGGTLELVAEPGPGAVFRLSLPCASAAG